MSKDNNGPENPGRRGFFGKAAAAGAVAATGGTGAVASAAAAGANKTVSLSVVASLSKMLLENVRYSNHETLGLGDRIEQIRENILGKGTWSLDKPTEGQKPIPWLDNKVDISNQNSFLSKLKKLPQDVPIRNIFSEQTLADIFEGKNVKAIKLGREFRGLLDPLCDENTTASDLIGSFRGFFEKIAQHAINTPSDFVIHGEEIHGRPKDASNIRISQNDIETLIDKLEWFEKRDGVRSPLMDSLKEVNKRHITQAKQEWFEIIDKKYKANDAIQEADRVAERQEREEFRARQQREHKKSEKQKKENPTSRSERYISLEHVAGNKYAVGANDKGLPMPTRMDWLHWLQSHNPEAKAHHIHVEDDGRMITIEPSVETMSALRELHRGIKDRAFGVKLPNCRVGIDLNQKPDKALPLSRAYQEAPLDSLKLNTTICSVSAANLLSDCDALGIQFAKASKNMTDELTGLNTTAGILAEIEKQGQSIGGYNTDSDTIVVAHIDIEHFRRVNDALGHEIGDTVLEELAERLKNSFRYGAILGRTQGDEMVVLFHDGRVSEDNAFDNIQKGLGNMHPILFNNNGKIDSINIDVHKQALTSAEIFEFKPRLYAVNSPDLTRDAA